MGMIDTILKRYGIDPKFWPEFHLLEGFSRELRARLALVTNYQDALKKILSHLASSSDLLIESQHYEANP
jgi:hypothetical protein